MDTGSHILFGVTIAGAAHLLPAVQNDPALSMAVLCVAIVGSNAPDADAVIRLRGTDAYVKHHRGWTHSVPAMLLWPLAIGSLAAWAFGETSQWLLLFGLAMAAVVLHVLCDLTNAYGVQCLLPFRRDWLHLDAICLTDPALLVAHVAAAAGWVLGLWGNPGAVCLAVWGLSFLYAAWRIAYHAVVSRRIKSRYRGWKAVHVLPDLFWHKWHYVVQNESGYHMGSIVGRRLLPAAELPYSDDETAECVNESRRSPMVQALLHFAKRAYVKWQKQPDGGYLVTWTDLRFWRDRDWPFRAEVRMDGQFNLLEQKIGWHKKAWEPPYV